MYGPVSMFSQKYLRNGRLVSRTGGGSIDIRKRK
jgi:hypothetical protein